MGLLKPIFELPAFWLMVRDGTEFACDEMAAFIESHVPFAFRDPAKPKTADPWYTTFVVCRTRKDADRARRARARAHANTPYPEHALLLVFQGAYRLWVRPAAGRRPDPIGLWIFLAWMMSRFDLRIVDDETDRELLRSRADRVRSSRE